MNIKAFAVGFVVAATLAVTGVANAAPQRPTGTVTGETVYSYGDSAQFSTTVSGRVPNKGYLYLSVVCWQGTERVDPVVYQWSNHNLDFAFPLIDQNGQGLEWDGQAASCAVVLYYREDNGPRGSSYIEQLDRHDFEVTS
jgi:hypothetical protein